MTLNYSYLTLGTDLEGRLPAIIISDVNICESLNKKVYMSNYIKCKIIPIKFRGAVFIRYIYSFKKCNSWCKIVTIWTQMEFSHKTESRKYYDELKLGGLG